jgi:outer membrane receptor protein involved in Fe transport
MLGATALQTGALILFGSAAPAFAQTNNIVPQGTSENRPVVSSATTNAALSDTAIPVIEGGNATSQPSGQNIVVTGSRIRLPNATSNLPITSVSGEKFIEQGRNSIGDALNDLPQLSSTFSQQNPGAGVGIAGLNLLDLRGLGTSRTLVLVNGRRHVGSDILNNAVSVDTNTIPSNLVERVDIVTGGNSAVYGSDAIAGVVNFVLKDHYDGIQLRANAGVTERGFGDNQTISLLAGRNFADGRGNVTISGEYSHASRVWASDVPWMRSVDNFVVVDVDPAANSTNGITNGSDAFPDRVFFRDIRLGTTSAFGIVPINQQPSVAACGTGIGSTAGAPGTVGTGGGSSGLPYNCNYIFTADGSLTQQTGTRVSTGIVPTVIGGNGLTGREDRVTSVLPLNKRYVFNAVGHYAFAPSFELFFEGKYAHSTSLGNASGPSFFSGAQTQFDVREKVRLDNPFLSSADRTTLANLILGSGCNTSFTTACPNGGNLTATDRANITSGAYRFALGKVLADVGVRDELAKRTVKRAVVGVRGSFFNDWNYEVSANYGKMTETIDKRGYVDKQRFVLSMDAGRNPVTGQIQCRSQFDPGVATQFGSSTLLAGKLAADIAACVPYNPFGGRADNAAAIKYFEYHEHDTAKMDQLDIGGFVGGTTSSFFNLPGGPVRFALGAEYRKENIAYVQDPYAGAGFTNALSGLGFAAGPFKVREAYGELNVPLLKDLTFVKDLTLHGAARVSDYNSSAGTVWTYNYGGDYAPARDIRFRVNYGRAVRAPNLSETSGSLTPNFANSFQDPCRASNIGSGTQYRAANCAADLGALLNSPSFANQAAYSLPVISGSNPNLTAEKADSWTYGVVVSPRWVPNLTISADYYDIKVKGVITSVSAQTIANSCYDLPTLDNLFCRNFTRYRGSAPGPLGEIPGQILGNSLIQAPLNFAKRVRRGIDTQVNYRTGLFSGIRLSTNLIYTHVIKSSNYVNPQDPNFEDRLLTELGFPDDEFVWDVDLKKGPFTLGYRMHYLSAMYLNFFEDFNSLQGRAPQNADYADRQKYPAVMYHGLRGQLDLNNIAGFGKSFQIFAGVDNVFDKHPPLGLTAIGAGSAIYDFRGRTFYGGIRADF